MDVEHTLEVQAGRAQPSTIGLSPGEPVGPLSIGRMGGWRVAANGVAAEHGFLYFDGQDLWLQSVDPTTPMFADGMALPTEWTAVRSPCEIVLGAAKIRFAETEVEVERTADRFPAPAPTGAAPSPPSQPAPPVSQRLRPQSPFAPGELARPPDPEDSTRMGPLDVVAARARAGALSSARPTPPRAPAEDVEEATRVPMGRGAPEAGPAPSAAPPAASPSAPRGGAPAPLDEKPTLVREIAPPPGGVMGAWRTASFPQKVTIFLLPLALASVYLIFTDPPPGPESDETPAAASGPAATSAAPAASSSPSSALASDGALPPASVVVASPPGEVVAAPASSPGTVVAAPSQGSVEATPQGTALATPPPGTVEAAPAAPSPGPSPARRGGTQRSLQRRAADSVAAGDWEGAAELYEQLAKEHPTQPAFAEAARILRSRR